jgi:hypothetical protein
MEISYWLYQIESTFGRDLITYFLIFIILFAVILVILRRTKIFGENQAIPAVISFSISVLSLWYLSQTQLASIILSYNLLGVFLLFLFPFALIFLLLHKTNTTPMLRRIIWIFFGIFYLYIEKTSEIGFDGTIFSIGLVLIGVAIIFDGAINKSINKK